MMKLYKYKEHGLLPSKMDGNIQVLGKEDYLTYMQFPTRDGIPYQVLDSICIEELNWVDGSTSDKRMKTERLDL